MPFKNAEAKKAWAKKYWERTKEATKASKAVHMQNFCKANPDYFRKWDNKNRDRRREITAKRRAAKKGATPSWLSQEMRVKMRKMYKMCAINQEVDHIVPLQGVDVCGLHVPWNLQILDRTANRQKGNKRGTY